MRTLRFSAFIAIAVLAASCSSDDGPTTSGELIGKWYNKETRVSGQTFPYEDHEACGKDYLEFNADGTGAFVDIYECNPYAEPFTYTRSGNLVTVSNASILETATIIELSETTLRVKLRYDYDGDGDEEDVIEVYTKS